MATKNVVGNKTWLNVGFDNYVDIRRVSMIMPFPRGRSYPSGRGNRNAAAGGGKNAETRSVGPLRRLYNGWLEKGLVVDLTKGRTKRSMVILDNGMVLVTHYWQKHLIHRISKTEAGAEWI